MDHVKFIVRSEGVDVGYHSSNVEPINREGCVGKAGINKTFTLEMVLQIAHKIENKPNIIIKAGPNAKWYLKRFPKDTLAEEIYKQKWRDTSNCVMYVVDWAN